MNRHQRRGLAKIQGKAPLRQAAGQLQQAVQALQSVQGLQEMPQQMADAQRLITEAHATVSALVEDYQEVADTVEALKKLTFRVMGSGAEEEFQRLLAGIQTERTQAPEPPKEP